MPVMEKKAGLCFKWHHKLLGYESKVKEKQRKLNEIQY